MLFACGRNWWCSWVSFFLSPSTHSHPSGCHVGLCIKDTRFDWVCCGAEGQSPYLSPRSLGGTSLTTVCESMFYIIWRQKMPILVWVVPKAGPDVRTWVTPGSKNNVESELGTDLGLSPPGSSEKPWGTHIRTFSCGVAWPRHLCSDSSLPLGKWLLLTEYCSSRVLTFLHFRVLPV